MNVTEPQRYRVASGEAQLRCRQAASIDQPDILDLRSLPYVLFIGGVLYKVVFLDQKNLAVVWGKGSGGSLLTREG